jgi:uncharacterized protein YciI
MTSSASARLAAPPPEVTGSIPVRSISRSKSGSGYAEAMTTSIGWISIRGRSESVPAKPAPTADVFRCKNGSSVSIPVRSMCLPDYFLVTRAWGPAWDPSRPRRAQDGWDEHAAFMDELVEDGFIVLGGPIGDDVDTGPVLQVVKAESEDEVRERLAADPWPEELLTIERIEPWAVWLRSARALAF